MFFNSNTFKKPFFLLLLSVLLVACDEEDPIVPTIDTPDAVTELVLNGNGLIITLLTDDADNQTDEFDGFLFVFNEDGTVVAASPDDTVNGTYSISRDDGRIELEMNFSDVLEFDELNDDWYFISEDQGTIRFEDDGDILEFGQP
jgi:hypothetical protein